MDGYCGRQTADPYGKNSEPKLLFIPQAIMFTHAAINEELVNSIPAKAHINNVKQVIIGLRVPNRSDMTPPIKFPATAPSRNTSSKRGTTVAG